MYSPQEEYFRKSVREWFRLLQRELGHYEQTTHASLRHIKDIYELTTLLGQTYNNPSAFNISELDQVIDNWLKENP